ncbi:intracellular beta-galactosidase BgaD [Polyplosphaeria fusca]|uniref:beta-galactosidase n=1 Tax=Polyplosphaeria fusca TaxID=682080 RepID=A0A9P4QWJ3_9PLEO|nr:intracellular beta-galactosidase BgaD [Polyplosphaeria fusca]
MAPSGTHPSGTPDWSNLNVLHRNTLPPRAYFHNYYKESDALAYDVAKSKTLSLSGTWKFYHAKSPFEAPDNFDPSSFDTSSWADIAVPGMWQLQGFGKGPHYTNVNYPIPVEPPNVSFTDNETGTYSRKFSIPDELKGEQIRLRFEGVDSSFHVWVNGTEVGYSQGSRNADEFDITALVKEKGENTIVVKVYQFCDGTYIEDQDQWWLSGIFREVSLVGFPRESRIENVFAQTSLDSDYVDGKLKVRVSVVGSGNLRVKLVDAQKQILTRISTEVLRDDVVEIDFDEGLENIRPWTAEEPNLYHLVVSLNSEQHIAHRVGFRQVEMKDGLIKVNGKRIVFRGVNRHEHHPQYGRAVPLDFLKHDLLTMKRHNINAIRTSHQPNDPRLYDLANEMGFWVMNEADLECHGFESIADKSLSSDQRTMPFRERQLLTRTEAAKWTTDNPEWTAAYVDRARHLVIRDQLHPSVIVWSLGNEAFFGRNFKAMYEWIKEYDDSRPIHYEADIYAETMDMYSRMYPPIDEIVRFGEDEEKKKPLVLCEFIHAMGNGPGNIQEYVNAFYKYPKLQGGFAWEWANHGLLTRDKQSGDEFYGYGGDFGDEPNDSTFVMDGLLNSDHTPNPGLIEYKKAIEPVQLLEESGSKATFINRYDFATLDHLSCLVSTTSTAKPINVEIPSGVAPGQTFDLDLANYVGRADGDDGSVFTVSFRLTKATPYLESGFEVANAQIACNESSNLQEPETVAPSLEVSSPTTNVLKITAGQSTWAFNTLYGTLTSWLKLSTELISKAPEINFFRAPTDNDIPQDGADWEDKYLHLAHVSTKKVEWKQSPNGEVVIETRQRVAPPVLSWSIDCTLTYHFRPNGSLVIKVAGVPKGENLPRTLPRVGLVMEMPKQFDQVQWYGRGPGESYRDSKESQLIGTYSASVDELWTDYDVPQESSNRTDTRWLKVQTAPDVGNDAALFVQFADQDGKARKTFDFQATHYRLHDVAEATHPYKLRKNKIDDVVLRLDAAHHGLGSGSCGPRTLDKYALLTEEFEFQIVLQ